MSHNPLVFPASTFVSEEGKDFIRRCVMLEESKRFTIEEMDCHVTHGLDVK